MEDRMMYTGQMEPPNNGGEMPQTRSNTAAMPNSAVKPMAAALPKNGNMPNPPSIPKPDNTPSVPMPPNAEKMPVMANMPDSGMQSYKTGELPRNAPLAAGYVPYQQMNPPKYSNADALTHGTLFPGLDLPFMNIASKNNPYAGTPLGEVMALDFTVHELNLYLDTHKDDTEAFEMMRKLIKLADEGKRKYEQKYGPIDVRDLERASRYTWLSDPWPWDYAERTGGR